MTSETIANTKIGQIFIRVMAKVMESRLRYRFFSPAKILAGTGIEPGWNVLEVGCGTGFFTITAAQIIGASGALTSMDMLALSVEVVTAKVQAADMKNVRVVQGDALDTRLEKESLDAIILFGVIPAPMLPMEKLLAEMHRILKPGGMMSVWPPSWVHRSILKSGLFVFSSKKNGVTNYKRC